MQSVLTSSLADSMLRFENLNSNAKCCVEISEGELVTLFLWNSEKESDKADIGLRLSCESKNVFFPPHQRKKIPLIK